MTNCQLIRPLKTCQSYQGKLLLRWTRGVGLVSVSRRRSCVFLSSRKRWNPNTNDEEEGRTAWKTIKFYRASRKGYYFITLPDKNWINWIRCLLSSSRYLDFISEGAHWVLNLDSACGCEMMGKYEKQNSLWGVLLRRECFHMDGMGRVKSILCITHTPWQWSTCLWSWNDGKILFQIC